MKKLSRRQFLCSSTAFLAASLPAHPFWPISPKPAAAGVADDIRGGVIKGDAPEQLWKWSREGFLYKKLDNHRVMCRICPNYCVLAPGDRSVCRSKINLSGKLYTLVYGNPCSVNMDPIEKKPFYHFKPQSKAFSVATTGCNFRCLNCQNWEISQAKPEEVRHYDMFPPDIVDTAIASKAASIAYTYSEPITFFEYMIDTARLARDKGIHNLLISNGFINREPLIQLCRVLDAANINLKAYSDSIYRKLNGGRLEPVLDTFRTLHEKGIHFEMTSLVVPGYIDNDDMIKEMCAWILENLGPGYPLHFLRFFPRYKLNRLPPTPVSTLTRLRRLALQEGIHYVYVGNVPDHDGNNTYCHNCKKLIISRQGYFIPQYHLVGNRCRFCDTVIPGVWT